MAIEALHMFDYTSHVGHAGFTIIQRGSGFASLLPLLLGPIVAEISRLINGK